MVCSSRNYVCYLTPFYIQVLNHPDLLVIKDQEESKDADQDSKREGGKADVIDWSQYLPEGYIEGDISQSGKLSVLFQLLEQLRSDQDRIVIVSNYTTTLRLLEALCLAKGYKSVRYLYLTLSSFM